MAVTIRLFLAHRTFSNELTKLLRNVNQGSAIWEKLQHNSLSLEEKLATTNRLSRQDLRIKELGLVVQEHLDAVLRCFQIFSCTVASFLCVCCQLFMFSFWKLIRSNLREASKPKITLTIATTSLNYESPADESGPQTDLISVNQVQSGAMLSNRQLTLIGEELWHGYRQLGTHFPPSASHFILWVYALLLVNPSSLSISCG
ncbi:hypothetical protein PGTUg99_022374 [Puccinia graminis f. sp. tritici]|uniref:Uncharacterized protein n=1 Tax=Puccinia graminis f. sp. tritici TaxID=56615 RepID=A0A5B0NGI8_PUCGR|nr:hypothetical protein PGTUg99_022374 [Puccinia graminis f. sp. tritici]